MKKSIFALITLCFLLLPTLAANAEAIALPDNDFLNRNFNQCVYLGRSFNTNGADGSVSAKNEPGSGREISVIENGETIHIEYTCLYKGDFWGLASFYPKEPSKGWKISGWIKMDQLLVLYDYVAFEEEHLEEFYPYKGDYDKIKKARSAIAWSWPGSGTPLWTIEDLDTANFRVSHAYKDEQGREWGFISNLSDSRNIWICLSDPLNRKIPPFNPSPGPMPWVSETTHADIGNSGSPTLVLTIILVAVLVIGTIVLIRVFWKPNKIKQGGEYQ